MNHIIADWPAPSTVQALSTTRIGPGKSKPPFDAFNLGLNTNDNACAVEANRLALAEHLKLPTPPMWLKQVHGYNCIEYSETHRLTEPTADASFTHQNGQVLAVLTADCVPIVLTDNQGSFVSAVHAGWRGLHQSIIQHTVEAIDSPYPLLAWIGPCIRAPHYAVDSDFKERFIQKDPRHETAFSEINDRIIASLPAIAHLQLQNVGVESITDSGLCTYSDSNRFYSHRLNQENSGRMATLIWKTAS